LYSTAPPPILSGFLSILWNYYHGTTFTVPPNPLAEAEEKSEADHEEPQQEDDVV
jgi:hypothetical protein